MLDYTTLCKLAEIDKMDVWTSRAENDNFQGNATKVKNSMTASA